MKRLSIVAAIVVGFSSAGVLAQDAPGTRPARPHTGSDRASQPDVGEAFKRFDANGDGKISKEEAPPRLVQNWDSFDVNKDGFITLREFRAVRSDVAGGQGVPHATPADAFKRFDVNGDGKISKEEAPPRLVQNWDRFDLNKDGFITLREFNAARSDRPQRAGAGASGSGQ